MKCNNKECQNDFCVSPINHLNRIEGQIKKIKQYIESGAKCRDVSRLLKSVSSSFDSVRNNIFKNFILDKMSKKNLTKKEIKEIDEIFNSFK